MCGELEDDKRENVKDRKSVDGGRVTIFEIKITLFVNNRNILLHVSRSFRFRLLPSGVDKSFQYFHRMTKLVLPVILELFFKIEVRDYIWIIPPAVGYMPLPDYQ